MTEQQKRYQKTLWDARKRDPEVDLVLDTTPIRRSNGSDEPPQSHGKSLAKSTNMCWTKIDVANH